VPSYQSYAVQLADNAPLSRDELMQQLLDAGIATRRGIMLSHLEPPYANGSSNSQLRHSRKASERSLLLPLFPTMTDQQQGAVVTALFQDESRLRALPAQGHTFS
jgi:dTDP-4-amino-4,6-dideoxygalactose transaminase